MVVKNFYELLYGSDSSSYGHECYSVQNYTFNLGSLAKSLSSSGRWKLILSPDVNSSDFTTRALTNALYGDPGTISQGYDNDNPYFVLTGTYTNSSGSDITINCAGMTLNDNYGDVQRRCLMFYQNLPTPITVANGSTVTIAFRMDVMGNVSLN